SGRKFEQAIEHYRRAPALRPGFSPAMNNLANAPAATAKDDEAISLPRVVIQPNPGDPHAPRNPSPPHLEMKDYDSDISELQRALALRPFAEAWDNLGSALQHFPDRLDEAIAAHRRAIELRPDFYQAQNNLGIALLGKGQLDEAVGQFR